MKEKIFSLDEMEKLLTENHSTQKIVFMSGVFDWFHFGHYNGIHKASKCAEILVVQIDGNELVKSRKGPDRPILDEQYRAKVISTLEFVDYVFISNAPSESETTLKKINPHVYVRAVIPGQSTEIMQKRESEIKNKLSRGEVFWIDQTLEVSTTKILNGSVVDFNE